MIEKSTLELQFSSGVKYKNLYYLTTLNMNALFMYDERKNKLSFVMHFQKETEK